MFLDNHDVNRIFNLLDPKKEESKPIVLSMLTYMYMSYGIPIFYYGTEALFPGGRDPENREWFAPLTTHAEKLDKSMI